jgi:hypothetical protein
VQSARSGIQRTWFVNQHISVLVYRHSESRHSSREILAQLESALRACLAAPPDEGACLDLLLRAGELECALADMESSGDRPTLCQPRAEGWDDRATDAETGLAPSPAQAAALIADAAAAALLGDASRLDEALRQTAQLNPPEKLSIKPAEGFAFYAVHPRLYVRMVEELRLAPCVAIVGIRSIGTTLSAVVTAAARQRGHYAERITVRPFGHPYGRQVRFDDTQRAWIAGQIAKSADFLVVDEGPGRSGSSFLATAEALEGCGISRERIWLLCSHGCDPQALLAHDAAARWPRFRVLSPHRAWLPIPAEAAIDVSGGKWREHLLPSDAEWPASWTATERLKFLARDRRWLFKFEGYGSFGGAALDRAEALWRAGFGPRVESAGQGFLAYELLPGAAASGLSLSPELAQRLAAYCAFRAQEFAIAETDAKALREMTQCNLREEFAIEPPELNLEIARPAICDARLQPHEWIVAATGELLKCDATSHGDDHFYPGPCDIAWDIAGCIVEWRMSAAAADAFIAGYTRLTGDDVRLRLSEYLLAYTAFRMGSMKMAADSCSGSADAPRLLREYGRYRGLASVVSQFVSRSVRQLENVA